MHICLEFVHAKIFSKRYIGLAGGLRRRLLFAALCTSLNIYIVRVLSVHIIPGCVQAKSGSAGVTCLASGPRPGLVSGSREGIITSWAVDSGTTLQTIDISQVQPASKLAPPAKGGPSVF